MSLSGHIFTNMFSESPTVFVCFCFTVIICLFTKMFAYKMARDCHDVFKILSLSVIGLITRTSHFICSV